MPNPRNLTPRILEMAVLYVDGRTAAEVADHLGVSTETVKSALVTTRQHLRREGYRHLSNPIGLRKALRTRGNLDHIDSI